MEIILLLGLIVHIAMSVIKKFRTEWTIKNESKIYIPKQLGILLVLRDFFLAPIIFAAAMYFFKHSQFIYSQFLWSVCYLVMSCFMTASIALKFWAYRACDNKWSSGLSIFKDHSLVTVGPYAFVRHPVYVSYALFVFACISSGNVWMMILAIIFFWINFKRAQVEDKALKREFGNQYLAYEDETGSFLPYNLSGGVITVLLVAWCVLLLGSVVWKVFY